MLPLPTDEKPHEIQGAQQYLKFKELITKGFLTQEALYGIIRDSIGGSLSAEEALIARNIPKHEVLRCISAYYNLPFAEYSDALAPCATLLRLVNLEALKQALWFPVSGTDDTAHVIVYNPQDDALCQEIKKALKVNRLQISVALASDIVRMVENQQDINPGFPPSAGRTPLARLRTLLADHRVLLAQYRTSLAKGRTGLSFIRTGISFISIGLVLFRIFGIGYLNILEILLVCLGLVMAVDGLIWYAPVRKVSKKCLDYNVTEPTFGTTVLTLAPDGNCQHCTRTEPIPGAEAYRRRWNRLSPVSKRRFLAIDRTDLADERSALANYRTIMARARTGLAFTRTGISFIGLGVALIRQFSTGPWSVLDGILILLGLSMSLEGIHWFVPGLHAGKASVETVTKNTMNTSIWDFMFNPFHKNISPDDLPPILSIKGSHAPGIWGTTGLALERTLIAERRNVKARLRTIMARSRTGLAFIRTGTSIFSVGMGLLVYFGTGNGYWTLFNGILVAAGLIFIADGLYWHIPAEKTRRHFPYCFGDMEFVIPDYAKPASAWKKIVLSHGYL
jgi:uncharacterized membrane protein YidH (DUF202 family)